MSCHTNTYLHADYRMRYDPGKIITRGYKLHV